MFMWKKSLKNKEGGKGYLKRIGNEKDYIELSEVDE